MTMKPENLFRADHISVKRLALHSSVLLKQSSGKVPAAAKYHSGGLRPIRWHLVR